MSIFQKDCPRCAAPNSVRAPRCHCGYYFETTEATGKQAATEVALQEETLYQDYLEARVVQAEATVEVARSNAAVDTQNTYKAAQVLVSEQALSAARAELRAQSQRTAELKKISRSTSRAPAPKPANLPAILARHPAPSPAPTVKIKTTKAPFTPAPVVKPTVKLTLAPPPPKPQPKPEAPPPSKAASAQVTKPAETPIRPPVYAKRPGKKFRMHQAAKAEAVVRAQTPVRPLAAVTPVAAPVVAEPTTPKSAAPTTKDCPNCTAAVAPQVERCRCGYEFPNASREMAPLSLDADARAILANDTSLGRTRRG